MKKQFRNRLRKQILRICEKQYRKGFQQGYEFCKSGLLTSNNVSKWRHDHNFPHYSKVIDPLNKRNIDPIDILDMETGSDCMSELRIFFNLETPNDPDPWNETGIYDEETGKKKFTRV